MEGSYTVGVFSQKGSQGLSHIPLSVFLVSMGINLLCQIVSTRHDVPWTMTIGPASHPWTGTSKTINPMELVTTGTGHADSLQLSITVDWSWANPDTTLTALLHV